MTTEEFSNEFDVLYNNIMSNQAPGLDEYEKSVFLTKAQYEIVKNYFTSTQGGNKYQQGFDDSEKRQIDFSNLITQRTCLLKSPSTRLLYGSLAGVKIPEQLYGTAPEAVLYNNPTFIHDILLIVSERVVIVGDKLNKNPDRYYQVVPIKLKDLSLVLSKPYGRPLKRQVWRVIETFGEKAQDQEDVSFASKETGFRFILHDIDKKSLITDGGEDAQDCKAFYHITYLVKPSPIILIPLKGGVSIEGESIVTDCKLNKELHQEILQRAVELAKAAYIGDLNSSVELGKRSE